jgi:UDP-2,4-diacetamido-2,4,6-trideoxy-beta-L-altropyranose hydrolase
MRCITLAETLALRGAACAFAVNDAGASLLERFAKGAFAIHQAPAHEALKAAPFDTLVIDDYAVAAEQEAPMRGFVRILAVIDDLANRPHVADLLIDPGYGRAKADYDHLAPAGAERLVGPAYALVKPAFVRARAQCLSRPIRPEVDRLFVSFGLSDVGGVTARAIAAIRSRHPSIPIDAALGADAQSSGVLKKKAVNDPNLHLHFDAGDVAALMIDADAAVGAGGGATWERACLGLPTLAVIVADNQRPTIQRLAADGALLAVDLQGDTFEASFDLALKQLWAPKVRSGLRRRSAALCDGLGADRITDALLEL